MPRSPPRYAEQGQSHQSNCIKKEIHAEKTDAPPWLAEPGDWRCGQDALEWISSQYWLILVLRVPHHPFTANLSAWPSWVTSPAATSLPGSSLSAPFLGTTISPSPQPRSYNNRSTLPLKAFSLPHSPVFEGLVVDIVPFSPTPGFELLHLLGFALAPPQSPPTLTCARLLPQRPIER